MVWVPMTKSLIIRDFSKLRGKIGLFGGSFDPVHRVHVEIAKELLLHGLDSVIFIPAARNPLKTTTPTPDHHRVAMLELALCDSESLFISLIEIERGGPRSFTVDTVTEINRVVGPAVQLYWIIGSDCIEQLPQWHDVDMIAAQAPFLTVHRSQTDELCGLKDLIARLKLSPPVKSALLNNLYWRPGNAVSSTKIRDQLSGLCEVEELSPTVLDYIRKHGLYGTMKHKS
jgi:nicotinate-nucleotide adenylyltransferase